LGSATHKKNPESPPLPDQLMHSSDMAVDHKRQDKARNARSSEQLTNSDDGLDSLVWATKN